MSPSRDALGALVRLVAWHDSRPQASVRGPRGWVWACVVAAVFFWMSNPLVYVPGFHLSLEKAVDLVLVTCLMTLPWLRVPRVPWPWLVFHALAYASLLWTIDPHLTGYTNMLYLKITLVALLIAANCEPEVIGWGLGLGGVVVVALSIHAYREEMWGASYAALEGVIFTGVGTNQNILAYTVVVALAGTLALARRRPVPAQLLWVLVFGVNLYGLYLARSSTGYLAALSVVVVLGAVGAWPRLRSRGRRQVGLWSAGVGGFLLVAALGVITLLGDQLSTFSGRAPFWVATLEASADNSPVIGSGWGAVWQHPWSLVPPNAVADDIYARAGFQLSHGHNFFLDLVPELGVLGVVAALLILARCLRDARASGVTPAGADPVAGRLVVLGLAALLVAGITEPMFTVPLGWWTLAVLGGIRANRVRARRTVHPQGRRRAFAGSAPTSPS